MALAPLGAGATIYNLTASINPAQETTCVAIPDTNPTRGAATMTYDDVTSTLNWNITFGNVSPLTNGLMYAGGGPNVETLAHFHGPASPGQTAGVVIGLPLGTPKIGSMVVPAANRDDLMQGRLYINIHSTLCGGGEIRGQVLTTVAGPAVQGWGIWALGALLLGAAGFAARGEFRRA
ncbi:MAG: CHRD domain-containing protein [Candidatus Rokuibacteriota bacterium]